MTTGLVTGLSGVCPEIFKSQEQRHFIKLGIESHKVLMTPTLSVIVQIYTVFLNTMTASHGMEACEEAFSVSAQWFEAWAGAGQGDVVANEMTIIVQQVHLRPWILGALSASAMICAITRDV